MTQRRYPSPSEKKIVRLRQQNICACGCGEMLESGVHYDHIRGLWDEGTNDLGNFQALKPGHHAKKTAKEAKRRAKLKRIQAQDGLRKKKPSQADKAIERILGAK